MTGPSRLSRRCRLGRWRAESKVGCKGVNRVRNKEETDAGTLCWLCQELAFRLLCRKYGTTLAYTPMFHARLFLEDDNYRREQVGRVRVMVSRRQLARGMRLRPLVLAWLAHELRPRSTGARACVAKRLAVWLSGCVRRLVERVCARAAPCEATVECQKDLQT